MKFKKTNLWFFIICFGFIYFNFGFTVNSKTKFKSTSKWNSETCNDETKIESYWNNDLLNIPLPNCLPLNADGTFNLDLLRVVPKFSKYSLSNTVKLGNDKTLQNWMNNFSNFQEPFSNVQSILWHKISYLADFKGDLMLNCPGRSDSDLYAHMTSAGRSIYCAHDDMYSPDFKQELNCDNTKGNPPILVNSWTPSYHGHNPYCNRETAPVAIVSVDCVISESGFDPPHDAIFWNLMSFSGGGVVINYNGEGRWAIPDNQPITEYDELACVGTSIYPWGVGHFYNEILPRYLHLDEYVPERVPMLWPDGDMVENILKSFQENGLLSTKRQFIRVQSPRLHRARRMYIYTSDYEAGHTPLLIFHSHVNMRLKLQSFVLKTVKQIHNGLLILSRGQGRSRSLRNENEIILNFKRKYPNVYVDAFEPDNSMSLLDVSKRVYEAKMIVGSHGANLNNIFAARIGIDLIEISFNGGMRMPSDYFCLSRNLGFNYWLSPSLEGDYGSSLLANVTDILYILSTFLAK